MSEEHGLVVFLLSRALVAYSTVVLRFCKVTSPHIELCSQNRSVQAKDLRFNNVANILLCVEKRSVTIVKLRPFSMLAASCNPASSSLRLPVSFLRDPWNGIMFQFLTVRVGVNLPCHSYYDVVASTRSILGRRPIGATRHNHHLALLIVLAKFLIVVAGDGAKTHAPNLVSIMFADEETDVDGLNIIMGPTNPEASNSQGQIPANEIHIPGSRGVLHPSWA